MARSELEREIERWWEKEAENTANCKAADPAFCGGHVFEEAVRVEGVIVACTVRGDRLASRLAAHLIDWEKRRATEYKRIARAAQPPRLLGEVPPEEFGRVPRGEHERSP